ncbi:hypothetical protein V6V47_07680 [Micromonospora sp. CPCC 205539]|uniref:hypothetical protein n=1 Tax=Micromonospora sp. CPCC 205539 TaxID=3122408 RepID=UPI002FF2DCD9
MIGVLTEVGRRISGRWLTAVLLPGLLLVATGAVARALGHAHAVDVDRLVALADDAGRDLSARPARLVVTAVLALVAAGLAGTAAPGIGRLVQRGWLRERFLTGELITRTRWSRRSRALTAASRAGVPVVAAYLPQRPTWLADRVRLLRARVRAQYHVDAALVWPRLWLLLGEDARQPITDARARYGEAVALVGWAVLYLLLGVGWWPALLIGAGTLLTAWWRAREAMAELAELVEAAIDLRLRDLADALGLPVAGPELTAAEGRALDDRLGKAGPG